MEKRIPGKEGWESVVYDKLDRPVLSQDANQKANNKWMFVKYDVFGRIVYTGEYTDNRTRQEIQDQIDGDPALFETKEATVVTIGDASVNYSNTMFPSTNITVFSTIYYDNYGFDKAGFTVLSSVYSETVTSNTKTLVTGSKVRTLGTTNWTTSVMGYDDKARPISVQSKNEYLQTTDVIETDLDFIGNVIENKSTHTKSDIAVNITTYDYFTYDHSGRLLKQTQRIGGNALELISYNKYNDLGQLVEQKIGGNGTTATSYTAADKLQKVDFGFNVRGWLTKINNTSDLSTDGDLFAYEIKYNNQKMAQLFG